MRGKILGMSRKVGEGRVSRRDKLKKKEEFSGFMRCMGPENSFPQICVVSENEFVLVT